MYFNQPLERVKIGDKTFPVKIDMYVLEKIQEEYGNINNFELKIKGLIETGDVDENGERVYKRVEPSIGVMNFVFPLMVREGCDIEGIELDMTDKEMVRNIGHSYTELNRIIVKEFGKCFNSEKKESPSEKMKMK